MGGRWSETSIGGVVRAIDRCVGTNLGLRRAELGLSREYLASRLRIPVIRLGSYEHGWVRMDAATLLRVSTELQLPVSGFFADIEFPGAAFRHEKQPLALAAAGRECADVSLSPCRSPAPCRPPIGRRLSTSNASSSTRSHAEVWFRNPPRRESLAITICAAALSAMLVTACVCCALVSG